MNICTLIVFVIGSVFYIIAMYKHFYELFEIKDTFSMLGIELKL